MTIPAYDRKDPLYRRAKREGFRSRAAYKLEEIQKSSKLLEPGQRVVELGAWPGGWLQVASRSVGPKGRVVGVDLAAIDPLDNENVVAIQGDLSEAPVQQGILDALGGAADVLLSDAAPKLTGVRATDRAREEALLEAIEAAVPILLRPGGSLLVKLLDCPEADGFVKRLRGRFESCRTPRLAATRKGSRERYLLGRGWLG